jgi:hypothetical protein
MLQDVDVRRWPKLAGRAEGVALDGGVVLDLLKSEPHHKGAFDTAQEWPLAPTSPPSVVSLAEARGLDLGPTSRDRHLGLTR